MENQEAKELTTKAESLFARLTNVHDYIINAKVGNISMVEAKMMRFRALQTSVAVLDEAIVHFNVKIADPKEKIKFSIENFDDICDAIQSSYERIKSKSNSAPQTTISVNAQSSISLKPIELPKFDGDVREWNNWQSLYESIIHNNSNIPNIQKLYHLRTALIKEPLSIIENFALSDENYHIAYQELMSRYSNPRRQLNFYYNLIAKYKCADGDNSIIKYLQTHISAVKALKTLNLEGAELADCLLFQSCYANLGNREKFAFDSNQTTNKFPTTEELFAFLKTRVKTAELQIDDAKDGRSKPKRRQDLTNHHVTKLNVTNPNRCPQCDEDHKLFHCPKYLELNPHERNEFLRINRLCFNCLGHHLINKCKSIRTCNKCRQRHHSSIHDAYGVSKPPTTTVMSCNQYVLTPNDNIISNHATKNVLLATALVDVISSQGSSVTVRALIDPGSEISFMTERTAQLINIKRQATSVTIMGVGAVNSVKAKGMALVRVQSRYKKDNFCMVNAHFLAKLTAYLPSTTPLVTTWPHLTNLQLADPSFAIPGRIDLLLGADIYPELLMSGLLTGMPNSPVAQKTIFGWILSGPTGIHTSKITVNSNHCIVDNDLNQQVQRFWQQETIPEISAPTLSPSEQECEDHFKITHQRTASGRYQVRLPLQDFPTKLGNSRNMAYRRLYLLKRKLDTNTRYGLLYHDFLNEYERLGHMERIASTTDTQITPYYLPHHGVFREHSATTKLRVVFDASAATSTGTSLNDILHIGPKLQNELCDVLLWFRRFRYVMVADIEKMYRQILIHKDDRDLQRILWFRNGNPVEYRLNTVTYGEACAPYQALRVLSQLIEDEGPRFPLAVPMLQQGRYVDDVFGGSDTIKECQEIIRHAIDLCNAGGFPLRKWIGNHPKLLEGLEDNLLASDPTISFNSSHTVRTLGLSWETQTDDFHFNNNFKPLISITKRSVLSRTAQLFDPLGFIAPVIIMFKIFLQELWLKKLDWDESLPTSLIIKWKTLERNLERLSDIAIPRFLGTCKTKSMELHGFCDASASAMSAVIYLRTTDSTSTKVILVMAKTKLAPIKRMTIPRLELTAAVLLTRLASHVTNSMKFENESCPITLWTDSSVALTWITSRASKWKEFVANRVSFIQEKLPQARWRFVSGKENPADCATRGLSPKALQTHHLWWTGPKWLSKSASKWPTSHVSDESLSLDEIRLKTVTATARYQTEPDILFRYSSFTRLIRIIARCLQFTNRLKQVPNCNSTFLTTSDLNTALLITIGLSQRIFFSKEIAQLKVNQSIPDSNPLSKFNPFVDSNNLLRIGGRLRFAFIPDAEKHPFIISKFSALAPLVIRDAHSRSLHGGTTLTMAVLRQKFWVLGGRPQVRKEILKCVICTRHRGILAQQLMGQLPPARVNITRPFCHSGIDYAGPITLRSWSGRGAKTHSAYIAIFVCFTTAAIHLELVSDYTAAGFVSAFKRFTSRRGIPTDVYSDCGTNFIGANAQLRREFAQLKAEWPSVHTTLVNDGTEWHFSPPSAPHFNGRAEAGVKSVKYHLRRILSQTPLTFEEFSTVLCQIEAVLNSRPLTPLSEDPEDLDMLTPGHFLTGGPTNLVPTTNMINTPVNRLKRWQLLSQMAQQFWKRWSREYLQQLQGRAKWRVPNHNICVGSIVLIADQRYPPGKWPLGRVIQLHTGDDSLVRVVTLKTATGEFKRPISKLCLLPIN